MLQTKEAAKKSDRASPTKKNPPAKAPAPVAAAAAVEERATPSSLTMEHPSSPTEAGVDAKLEMKYKEKLYIQVGNAIYNIYWRVNAWKIVYASL